MEPKPQPVSLDSLEIDLGQYWLILKRRWIPATGVFSLILILAALFASSQKPTYLVQGKLLLKVDRVASLTGVGSELGEFSPLTLQSSPLRTESEVLLSAPLLEKTIFSLDLRDEEGNLLKPGSLQEQLEVKAVTGTDVLLINLEGDDPQLSAAIVNKLMEEYIANNILMSRKQATEAREVIGEQLPKAEEAVQQADEALRDFKQRNGITNLPEESKALVTNAASLDSELTKARQALADASSRLSALQNKVGLNSDAALELSSLSQSPGVQQALQDLQAVQAQLAAERSRYEDQYPTVVNLRQKEAFLRDLLQERVRETLGRSDVIPDRGLQMGSTEQDLIQQLVDTEVQRSGLVSQIDELTRTRELYRQRSVSMPSMEQQLNALQRRLDIVQSTYQTLVKTYQEVEVAEQQNTGNANIIERALPPNEPAGNEKFLLSVLGGMLAMLGALSTIILLEILDRSVKTSKEVRKLFRYPYLGTIPQFGNASAQHKNGDILVPALPARDFPQTSVGAAYRLLQANLKFINAEKNLKTIVVTSSLPQEGKSTVAANLATTMAQLGRRVLLIDADLHYPQQHHIWNVKNTLGLSDVIVKQLNLDVVVHPTIDNLDLLTSGAVVPNPLAILDSISMRDLVTTASQHYDFVILDTSPLIVEAEALTLGKITDGLMLVARPGTLDVTGVKMAKELLHQSAQTILGIVVNCAASESEAKQLAYYQKDERKLLNSST